jgi:tetratricopeptide (TPR) repeat protein
MRRTLIKLSVFISFCVTGIFSAPGANDQQYLDSALHFLVNQNYNDAYSYLQKHSMKYPSDNEALYLSFVIDQTRILDYESYYTESKAFISAAESLKTVLERRLPELSGKDSIECLLYIANITGGVSVILSKAGNWFEAVKNALASIAILKKVKKLDPDCYEANLGIGVFNYYLSNSFKWLPFVQDKEKEGIKLVEKALNSRVPYNYAAKSSLCWILIEQQDFRKADSLARSVLNELPDNTIFLRISAYISLWSGKYDAARKQALRIIKSSEGREPLNWANLVTAYYVMVSSYMEQKNNRDACLAAEEFMARQIPQQLADLPHIKKNIKMIEDIQKKYRQ